MQIYCFTNCICQNCNRFSELCNFERLSKTHPGMFFFLSCNQNRAVAYTDFMSRNFFFEIARSNRGHAQHYNQFGPSKSAAQKLTRFGKNYLEKKFKNYV